MPEWSLSAASVVGRVPATSELRDMVAVVAEAFAYCPICAGLRGDIGLTVKCRDWHDRCPCGQMYAERKNKDCRRRTYMVDGKSIPAHPKPERETK